MKVQITCPECTSAINLEPTLDAQITKCDICSHELEVSFKKDHLDSHLSSCPVCERKDFYQQKDFNRKIGVILFVIGAILVPWTYGLSLFVLWLLDYFLFSKIAMIAICYKCTTVFRDIKNMDKIGEFNHEMHDRIVYSDHDFEGRQLDH